MVYFIEVGQYDSLSWQSVSFLTEGLYTPAGKKIHTLQHQDWVSVIELMQDDWYNFIRVQHM